VHRSCLRAGLDESGWFQKVEPFAEPDYALTSAILSAEWSNGKPVRGSKGMQRTGEKSMIMALIVLK